MQLRCSQDAPSPSAAQHGASCAHFPPTRRAVRSPLPTRSHDPSVAIVRSWGRCGLPGSRAGGAMDEPSPVLPIFHYRYRVYMRLPSPNPAGPYCPPVPPDWVVSPPVAAAVACAALAQTASVLSPSAFALPASVPGRSVCSLPLSHSPSALGTLSRPGEAPDAPVSNSPPAQAQTQATQARTSSAPAISVSLCDPPAAEHMLWL